MPTKEAYCYKILKKHHIIVDFDGEVESKKLPEITGEETFKQWKDAVLGQNATDVIVYAPTEPAPQTKIKNLQTEDGARHLGKVINSCKSVVAKKSQKNLEKEVSQVESRYTKFPTVALEGILDEQGEQLEESVREFFQRFLDSSDDDIDTEDLIKSLVVKYNEIAKRLRE